MKLFINLYKAEECLLRASVVNKTKRKYHNWFKNLIIIPEFTLDFQLAEKDF